MSFGVVLFLAVLGLQNVHSDGKSFDVAERAKDHGIVVDLSVGALDGKPRGKRNAYDSNSSEYVPNFGTESERASTESLREYIRLIERYLPAIKENVENIQRKFSDYQPDNQGFENRRDEIYDLYDGGQINDLDPESGYNEEDDFFQPATENGYDSDKMYNNNEDGDNQTLPPDFRPVPSPEINWRFGKDEGMNTMEDLGKYEPTGNNDFTAPSFNRNNMSPNGIAPNRNFFNMKNSRNGMSDFCNQCGKPIQNCDLASLPVKPLVININSDCLTPPNSRFMNGIPFQSRGHCRPFNFMQSSQVTPKYRSLFPLGEMPRYYSRESPY